MTPDESRPDAPLDESRFKIPRDESKSSMSGDESASKRRPPLQFGIRSLLAITVAVALLFGTLRWLEVPPRSAALVLLILVVGVAAAFGLVVAIAGASDDGK